MTVGRSNSKTHTVGATAEDKAKDFLLAQGLMIVAQNWHQPRIGEIDIIAKFERTLVFIEVRSRKVTGFGTAVDSVTTTKQNKIIKTAQYFLATHDEFISYDCRFDVVAITPSTQTSDTHMEWIQGAFML